MKLKLIVVFLVCAALLSAQVISISSNKLRFQSLVGSTYNLLSATDVEGPWVTNHSFVASQPTTEISLSMTGRYGFYQLERLVPPTITLTSDPYVERLLTLTFSIPATNGNWKVVVRTNGSPFLTWNGEVTTDTLYVQENNFDRYGYEKIPGGFDVEVWVTNNSVRVTNHFHLKNHYRPLPPQYEGSVIEQAGVITGTGTNRLHANVALLQTVENLSDYWRYYDISTRTYTDGTNWNVLSSPTDKGTLRNYLAGSLTNHPSHFFYLGTNTEFVISNKGTFFMFVGFNAETESTMAAGPVKTWQELDAEGKYGRFALWIDVPIQGMDLGERLSEAMIEFLELSSQFDVVWQIRTRTFGEVLALMQEKYPELNWNYRGSPDADMDGRY